MPYTEDDLMDELLTIIKTSDNYNDDNSSIQDFKILDRGITRAVILEEGTFRSERDDTVVYMNAGSNTSYNFGLSVCRKYGDDSDTHENLRSDVRVIRELVDSYNTLNGKAQSCKVVRGDSPEYLFREDGTGPYFARRVLTVAISVLENREIA
jgi:hypothetical protein